MAGGSRLGVDFGTSNTVAVLARPDGRINPVLVDGQPQLPSAVCASDADLLVGRAALHTARLRPEAFEPNPKRRIDDGEVLLGTTGFPVVDVFAAVLGRVADETRRVTGLSAPDEVRITHPAVWGSARRDLLRRSAVAAGWPSGSIGLVPEPVAAAAAFAEVHGARLPVGGNALVYDLGGGTFDATVLRRSASGYDVRATDGLPDAGGLDIDHAILTYLGAVVARRNPDAWRALTSPRTAAERRARWLLHDDVRSAKELLSSASSTLIPVPLIDDEVPLTRNELDQLTRPLLERTMVSVQGVLREAGLTPGDLSAVFLVGGSTRIPLVATMLHRALGVPATVLEQPELIVAEGALQVGTLTPPATGPHAPATAPHAPETGPYAPATAPHGRGAPHAGGAAPHAAGAAPHAAGAAPHPAGAAPAGPPWPAHHQPPAQQPGLSQAGQHQYGPPSGFHPQPSGFHPQPSGFHPQPPRPQPSVFRRLRPQPHPVFPPPETQAAPGIARHERDIRGAEAAPAPAPTPPTAAAGPIDAPPSAAPPSATPVSAAPVSATPVSAAPVSAAPVSAAPASATPTGAAGSGGASRTMQSPVEFRGHDDAVSSVAISPDGTRLATASADRTVRIWETLTGRQIVRLTGHTGRINGIVSSPDGTRLISVADDHTARIWDPATGRELKTLDAHSDMVRAVAAHPDGRRIATGSFDRSVRIWDYRTGELTSTLTGHTDVVRAVAFHPDGRRIATGSFDETVRIWDLETGRQLAVLTGHGLVHAVTFSPFGRLLATAGVDGTARLWHADTGRPAADRLAGHDGAVTAVAFSPDGRLLATAGIDGTARLWSPATGRATAPPLTGHTAGLTTVLIAPDGRALVTASHDGTAKLWPL
nr:Hsp70 family protein [Cryptosporangium phraense]